MLDELSRPDPNELAAICHYVEHQRNSYNPAGLAVFLARSGFGKTLLRAKPERGAVQTRPRPKLIAPTGGTACCPTAQRDPNLDALWNQTQAQLAQQLPAHEFTTWLQDTQLVDLDEERAVIGVPNIFARERAQAHYAAAIRDAVAALAGKRVIVEVVIDHGR